MGARFEFSSPQRGDISIKWLWEGHPRPDKLSGQFHSSLPRFIGENPDNREKCDLQPLRGLLHDFLT